MSLLIKNMFKRTTPIKHLGRWNTVQKPEYINLNTDWANHDHCGGEVCQLPENKTNQNNETKKTNTEKTNKFNENTEDDFYLPYVM